MTNVKYFLEVSNNIFKFQAFFLTLQCSDFIVFTYGPICKWKLQYVKLWGWFHCPGLEPGPPARGSTMAEWQNFFSNLQLWQPVTLQSFVLQRLTVSLWKGLSLIKNILSIQKVGRIFNIDFALSKWPHLHRPYVVGGCLFNLGTVTRKEKPQLCFMFHLLLP